MLELALPVHEEGILYQLDTLLAKDIGILYIHTHRNPNEFRYGSLTVGSFKKVGLSENQGKKQIDFSFYSPRFHLKLDRRIRAGSKLGDVSENKTSNSFQEGHLSIYFLKQDWYLFNRKRQRVLGWVEKSLEKMLKAEVLSEENYRQINENLSHGVEKFEEFLKSRGYDFSAGLAD